MSKRVKSDLSVIAKQEKANLEAELGLANEEKAKLTEKLIIVSKELDLQINRRKLAEESLRNSNIFSESLIRTIPFGMDIVDETGTVLFQSDNFKRILGIDAVGKKCWDIYHDNKKQNIDCPLIKGIAIGETSTYESHGVLSNRIVEISHTGMLYKGKKAMLEIFQDITERRNKEEELIKSKEKTEENEKRFRDIIFSIADWVWEVDEKGIYTYSSAIGSDLFGISQEEIIGKSPFDFMPPEEAERIAPVFSELVANKLPIKDLENWNINKNGELILLLTNGLPVFDNTGAFKGYRGVDKDITEQKKMFDSLIKAKEKAEESDRLKSAFLTNMSHEIRTPMNGILGFIELLKEPNLTSDDLQDFIQTIQISGARMLNTLNNIVDISKLESGLVVVDIKETNINEKIEFTYKFFKPEVEIKELQFFFKNGLHSKEAIIKTDNEKVYSILTNLVKNAIKFTYEGSIEFGYVLKSDSEPGATEQSRSATEQSRSAELEFFVKDTGIGIPQNQQQIIFERFRQGSESHDRGYEGSGLGLSISKSYVNMLGGKIWVESEVGKGSAFYFTIPYNAVSEEKTEILNAVPSEQNEFGIKNLKTLIVEDDEISYSLLTRTIQKVSYEVLHAITGVEAVEACRNNPDLDLVLMDIRMPGMDGNEATRQIRQFNKDVIIIAQTAFAFSGDSEKSIEAGCNDYISKPINKTLLYELIKKHCNK